MPVGLTTEESKESCPPGRCINRAPVKGLGSEGHVTGAGGGTPLAEYD